MSYCRFGPDSEVYVYPDVDGYIRCCACSLDGDWHTTISEDQSVMALEMIRHLDRHRAAGRRVPEYAYQELADEAAHAFLREERRRRGVDNSHAAPQPDEKESSASMNDRAFVDDVSALLDLIDGVDWSAPSDKYLWAFGSLVATIRGRIGASRQISFERLHTNDEQIAAAALERAAE